MPHDDFAAAAVPPPALAPMPAPQPEPELGPTWTRSNDKFLQLLFINRTVSIHQTSGYLRKTPAQMNERYNFMFEEMRQILEALEAETPPEWNMEIAATTAAPAAEEAPDAVVPASPPVVAEEDSAAPTVVGGGDRSGEGKVRRKKKAAVNWTAKEHMLFLAGLDKYIGNWKAMSREYLKTKSASQIASHYQKYRKREKQRERDECRRASIHDITAWKDELPRAEARAPGEEVPREPIESDEPTREDGLGPVEESPGADDPGTLLT